MAVREAPRTWRDLTFVALAGDIATFAAPSRSAPGAVNHVNLDTATGDIYCECPYCITHPDEEPGRCWLAREVRAAWRAHNDGERASLEERRDELYRRLAQGYARIERALADRRYDDMATWEALWRDHLAEYERVCEALQRDLAA